MVECTDPRLMGTWGTRTKYWLLVLNCVNLQNYEVLTASDFFRHNENLSRAIEEKQTPTLYLWERRLFFCGFLCEKNLPAYGIVIQWLFIMILVIPKFQALFADMNFRKFEVVLYFPLVKNGSNLFRAGNTQTSKFLKNRMSQFLPQFFRFKKYLKSANTRIVHNCPTPFSLKISLFSRGGNYMEFS
jgi:hypothetical protein